MRVAVMVEGDGVSTRFARAPEIRVYEVKDDDVELVESKGNPVANVPRGAGRQILTVLTEMNVEATVAARYGPNALQGLKAQGIKAYVAEPGTDPEEAALKAARGELSEE
ncbi:NifB/NifX family molybdenum-iron cluster-binding protein [Methanopyrus sp. SNP6]|uniref:NifB/NifX family molybdenum-iron cluster-binding protein n=1 Tax=Methanopyrus sp. SNP6 TaxID=1937005 RepID=UPI0011E5A706|nr:NifB/NifX family molybdenum-iron cluster-binding protein [Methanopyrus sp. SNP6]